MTDSSDEGGLSEPSPHCVGHRKRLRARFLAAGADALRPRSSPLAFANAFGYALIASRARAMVQNPKAISVFNKAGGTLLIGAGVATAVVRAAHN